MKRKCLGKKDGEKKTSYADHDLAWSSVKISKLVYTEKGSIYPHIYFKDYIPSILICLIVFNLLL